MGVSRAVLILAAAVAPILSAWAGPVVRLGTAPIVFPHAPGERQTFWRGGEGDHDVWRHRRHDFIGAFAPIVGGEAVEPGPQAAPSPFVVAAPITVNVTFAPAAGPPWGWADGPKLIEIGRSGPPRGRLPLVIYGD